MNLAVITWESLHGEAVRLFEELQNVSEQFKLDGLARVDAHANQVRKETDLAKLRSAVDERKRVVKASEETR